MVDKRHLKAKLGHDGKVKHENTKIRMSTSFLWYLALLVMIKKYDDNDNNSNKDNANKSNNENSIMVMIMANNIIDSAFLT